MQKPAGCFNPFFWCILSDSLPYLFGGWAVQHLFSYQLMVLQWFFHLDPWTFSRISASCQLSCTSFLYTRHIQVVSKISILIPKDGILSLCILAQLLK